MPQDLDGLKRLLTDIAILNTSDRDKVKGLASAEIGARTNVLIARAKKLGLDPEIIAEFDLPGIEAKSVEEFVGEAYYRFFPKEKPAGPERLR